MVVMFFSDLDVVSVRYCFMYSLFRGLRSEVFISVTHTWCEGS